MPFWRACLEDHLRSDEILRKVIEMLALLRDVSKDYVYESVFKRLFPGRGCADGAFIGKSTPGHSTSILRVVNASRSLKSHTIGFGVQGSIPLLPLLDLMVHAPLTSTPPTQHVDSVAAHTI